MRPPAADGQNHYFSRTPTSPSRPRQVRLSLPDLTLDLTTDAGVFSGDAVDAGTKYLLMENARPPKGSGNLLDLGCGYGPIALAVAKRAPETAVWAIDVNERAVELTGLNAEANGIENVHSMLPEEVPAEVEFDAIFSNPPIRIGKAALHEMLSFWLDRLKPDGTATLVIHKNLGSDSLQRWLIEQGWATDRLSSRAGYRLLEAHAR